MNEQELQELNKKLGRWAGFRYIRQEIVVKNIVMPIGSHWIDPAGNSLPDGTMIIDFTQSLNDFKVATLARNTSLFNGLMGDGFLVAIFHNLTL